MASEKIALATLFTGIGAAEFAAHEVFAEYDMAFACEIDKFARQSYLVNHAIDEKHFHRDIKELDAKAYASKVDILIGGSPCQDFSLAGLRAGIDGTRGELIYEFIRIVDECHPKVFIYENVKGFLSINHGKSYQRFLEALRNLGYHCYADVVNTKDYGIPQNRERIYIVGFLNSELYHAFEFAPKELLKLNLGDMLDREVDEKYLISAELKRYLLDERSPYRGCFRLKTGQDIANTINIKEGQRRENNYIRVIGKLDIKGKEQIKRVYDTTGLAPTIHTAQGGNQESKILNDGFKIRKLTPRECLRLQGFPESFKIVCSDTQTYKQAGNAMSVNVVAMILRQIQKIKEGVSDSLFAKAAV